MWLKSLTSNSGRGISISGGLGIAEFSSLASVSAIIGNKVDEYICVSSRPRLFDLRILASLMKG